MLRRFFLLVFSLLLAFTVCAEPFWGSRTSRPVDTEPSKLKPGQFIWKGDNIVPLGAMSAEVNISEQKIYLYQNSILIGVSTISTGRGRRSTPTGVFTVLGKNRYHRSKKYHNAPMPYTHWLSSEGIAMHAGNLPGYPASHGCIRLPSKFARFLFESSPVGMPVVITKTAQSAQTQNTVVKSEPIPAVENPAETKALAEIKAYRDEIKEMQAMASQMKNEMAKIQKQLLKNQ